MPQQRAERVADAILSIPVNLVVGPVSAETYAPGFRDSGPVAGPAKVSTRLNETVVSR